MDMKLKFSSYNEFSDNALCTKKVRLSKAIETEKSDYVPSSIEENFVTFKNTGFVEDSIKLKVVNLNNHNPEILEAYCKGDTKFSVVINHNDNEITIDENMIIAGDTVYKIYFSNQIAQKLTSLKLYEADKFKFYKSTSDLFESINKVEFIIISTAKTSKTHDVNGVHGFTLNLENINLDHYYFNRLSKAIYHNVSPLENDDDGHGYPYACMIGHNVCEYIDKCNMVNDFITDK